MCVLVYQRVSDCFCEESFPKLRCWEKDIFFKYERARGNTHTHTHTHTHTERERERKRQTEIRYMSQKEETEDASKKSLQEAKDAFYEENKDALKDGRCSNPKCGFKGCTCGEKCSCNRPEVLDAVTCDPCKDFAEKKMMMMEKE